MSIKLVVKIIIASAIWGLYMIFHSISYVGYNALALEQFENSTEKYLEMQAYLHVLNYSWIIVAVVMIVLFGEEIVRLIKLVLEKINE